MRRADRLFEIIQLLRRGTRPLTAASIARELETSSRTIYRDIAALVSRRVPIRGEAGLGYVLEAGFDLPPLMLSVEEIEAAALGAQWVAANGDAALAVAARDLMAKIIAVIPGSARATALDPSVATPPAWQSRAEAVDAAALRAACMRGHKMRLVYRDRNDALTERVVWPFLMAYRESGRTMVAWCEARNEVRSFRTDRMISVTDLAVRAPVRPAVLRARWLRERAALRESGA